MVKELKDFMYECSRKKFNVVNITEIREKLSDKYPLLDVSFNTEIPREDSSIETQLELFYKAALWGSPIYVELVPLDFDNIIFEREFYSSLGDVMFNSYEAYRKKAELAFDKYLKSEIGKKLIWYIKASVVNKKKEEFTYYIDVHNEAYNKYNEFVFG